MKSEDLPELDFELVQCPGLFPTEIRYLAETAGLAQGRRNGDWPGHPEAIKNLRARVEDYRSVYIFGRVGFLVTASFIEALDRYSLDAVSQAEAEAVR